MSYKPERVYTHAHVRDLLFAEELTGDDIVDLFDFYNISNADARRYFGVHNNTITRWMRHGLSSRMSVLALQHFVMSRANLLRIPAPQVVSNRGVLRVVKVGDEDVEMSATQVIVHVDEHESYLLTIDGATGALIVRSNNMCALSVRPRGANTIHLATE